MTKQMTLMRRIDLLASKKTGVILNVLSIPLVIVFYFLFYLISVWLEGASHLNTEGSMASWLFVGISLISMVFVHEGIHGVFFKLFNPKGTVKYGFKNGMAYATSPESFYNKYQFSAIILAPFVVITAIFFFSAFFGIIPYIYFIMLASLHAGSCIGDFYYIGILINTPKQTWVEDTEVGINLYQKD